ncbi:hypothetical protein BXZ70DRAFT_1081250 [Cristinia sonorae]|uniref:Uncharacterized protein n=1 Tax=Cristinia sonorae TaxID=1940300 RepID=A0A8K0UCK2_9AGAR|nr:hypothetical protein BXZ70DRAFT_1081250 [Cristinia sonorae]
MALFPLSLLIYSFTWLNGPINGRVEKVHYNTVSKLPPTKDVVVSSKEDLSLHRCLCNCCLIIDYLMKNLVEIRFFMELNYQRLQKFSAQDWDLASAGSETFIVALKEEEGPLGVEALCRDSAGVLLIEDEWRAQTSASARAVLLARGQI